MKPLRVGWLSDLDFWVEGSGAEANCRATAKEGIRRGHDIRTILPTGTIDLNGCDAVIISNATRFPPDHLEDITTRLPTFWLLHDYAGACHWRLFYPMDERCTTKCPQTPWVQRVFPKAEMLIWLSPLHREAWLKKHPELADMPYHLHPSPIDPTPFEAAAQTMVRQPGTVIAVNSLFSFKGKENVIRYAETHRDLRFTFVGGADGEARLPPNCQAMAPIANSQLGQLLAQHESFIHLPSSPMPFDRIVPEAVFSGCKLIVNNLIGALSFGWKTTAEMRAAVTESPAKFWEKIEGAIP